MRILWSIHLYLPRHAAGAEKMAHDINKFLLSKGHEIRVINNQADKYGIKLPYEFEGVEIIRRNNKMDDQIRWADCLISHLEYTHDTSMLGHILKRPVVHIVHNDTPYQTVINAPSRMNVVYNSDWIAEKLAYDWPSITLHPPCDYRYYETGKNPVNNEYITLINLNENKGGRLFSRLAEMMPDRKFLGVIGSYEEQYYRDLPNLTIMEKQVDIRPVYDQTRILLMLSRYESWGRTATEAMANGIPVVCTPTPGLLENCQWAGIYLPERAPMKLIRENVYEEPPEMEEYNLEAIAKEIRTLDNPAVYEKYSNLGVQRARELDPEKELEAFEKFLYEAVARNRNYAK